MDTIIAFFDGLPSWVNALTGLIAAAGVVAALTPTKSDDALLGNLSRLLNLVALNVRHSKNADDK